MVIKGLQKLSLLDYPDKLSCTVFTGGCNFRCPFCHNSSLVINTNDTPDISEEAFFSFLEKRRNVLDGVCITGGEPLLQRDIDGFIKKIKSLGFLVKLDTNGSFPELLDKLICLKLVDYVAMDIKNSLEKYSMTVGVADYNTDNIKKSISILINSGIPYEFRTTVVREFHTLHDFEEISIMLKGADKYYLQAFVDNGSTIKDGLTGYSRDELSEFVRELSKTLDFVEIRGI